MAANALTGGEPTSLTGGPGTDVFGFDGGARRRGAHRLRRSRQARCERARFRWERVRATPWRSRNEAFLIEEPDTGDAIRVEVGVDLDLAGFILQGLAFARL